MDSTLFPRAFLLPFIAAFSMCFVLSFRAHASWLSGFSIRSKAYKKNAGRRVLFFLHPSAFRLLDPCHGRERRVPNSKHRRKTMTKKNDTKKQPLQSFKAFA